MRKGKRTNSTQKRVEKLLERIAEEHPNIREELAKSLPSYNILLSLGARTFEEIALKPIAIKHGYDVTDAVFSYEQIKPPCVECQNPEHVLRVKENTYICKICNKKFTPNHHSISSRTNCSSLTWMKVLYCMLEFYSVKKTCRYCNISISTFYNIRNRLLYAMELLLEDVKLYGEIQCDNTFVYVSYKGYRLIEEMYPEDSPLDSDTYTPRKSRDRGGAYSKDIAEYNKVCIYCAIDNHGHSLVRYVGIGQPTATKLLKAAPKSKYLLEVPETDPFPLTHKILEEESDLSERQDRSLLISDKEKAIIKYASLLGIEGESHVFRKRGKQLKLSEEAHDIQRVNALHSRLKTFMAKCGFVSTKYLPGFLTLFEFIENTGATNEAIGKLFDILVTPGFEHAPSFFENKYTVPKLYFEWQEDNRLLQKLSYNKILVGYYCHQARLAKKDHSIKALKEKEILEETGYSSANTLRRIYKDLVSSRVIDVIYNEMSKKETKKLKVKQIKTAKTVSHARAPDIPKVSFEIYDEYCRILSSPVEKLIPLQKIIADKVKKTGQFVARTTIYNHLELIEKHGLRTQRLSELKANLENKRKDSSAYNKYLRAVVYLDEYNELWREYRKSGDTFDVNDLYDTIAARHNVKPVTVKDYVSFARNYRLKNNIKDT